MTSTQKLFVLIKACDDAYDVFHAACMEEMEAEIKWGDPYLMEEASEKVEAARKQLDAARKALRAWRPEEEKEEKII